MSERKFLILGIPNFANRRILYELRAMGYEAKLLNPKQLLPFINDKRNDRIYVQYQSQSEPQRVYKKSVSAIVPRIGGNLQFYSKIVEHLNKNIGIPSTSAADGLLNAQDKIKTIQLLSQNAVKTPRTFGVKEVYNIHWLVKKLNGFPVVAKLVYGSQGIGVFILTEPLSASTAIQAFCSQGHNLLLQQFIETATDNNKKHDFRYVVVDGKVVARMKRNSVGTDFRTNASLKEDCENAAPDAQMDEIALKAAAAVGLACAGVDLAKEVATGDIYCYEVNGNFNFKSTEKFTKVNVAKSIAEYAVRLAFSDTKVVSEPTFSERLHEPEFNISSLGEVKGIPFGTELENESDENDEFPQDCEFSPLMDIPTPNADPSLHKPKSYHVSPMSLKGRAISGTRSF